MPRIDLSPGVVLALALATASLGIAGCRAEGRSLSLRLRPAPPEVERILAERCTHCHAGSKITSWWAESEAAAKILLDRMVEHGALLTPAERATLANFFGTRTDPSIAPTP